VSDSPRTDEWLMGHADDTPAQWMSKLLAHTRQLERENIETSLLACKRMEELVRVHAERKQLRTENDRLECENAALRADKERLDYLERNGNLLRLTIDAVRKEAKP
jgi:hypothetical protein